jgi:HEAT repeat protein/beta-lactamase regulating signal transducer with metallopeptidase domain
MMSAPGTWALLADAAWRVTFILLTAWAVVSLLRRRPAAVRHGVWAVAIVSALAVPLASGVLPRWRLPVLPADAALIPGPGAEPAPSRPLAMTRARGEVATLNLEATAATLADADRRDAAAPAGTRAVAAQAVDWLGLVWVTIAAMVLGRYLASIFSVRWLLRQAEPVDAVRWRDAAEIAAAELGLRDTPPLLASAGVTVPFTAGLFRPVVVVPLAAVAHWSDERVRVVLLHELAHVRRRDCLMQAVTQVACAVYWFNPLAWIAARRLRAERERACDDLVLAAGLRGAEYAQHLLDIARTATSRRALSAAALAMARPSELEGRLLAILDSRPVVGLRAAGAGWRGSALAAAAVLALASVHPVAREVAPAAPTDETTAAETVATAGDEVAGGEQLPPTPAPTPTPAPSPSPSPSAAVKVITAQTGRITASISDGIAVNGPGVAELVADHVIDGLEDALEQAAQTPQAGQGDGEARKAVSPAVVQGLMEAMKDSDADVRKQALQALTRLRVPLAFDTLVAALKDPDADIREHAAFALGRTKDTRALAPLTTALQDEDADVREQAVFALSQLRSAEAVPALRKALSDASPDVREQAVIALWQLRDPASVPAFMQALKDEDADVREQAVFALSQLGDRSAVPALLQALASDPSDDVREQAAFALSQIGDESAVAGLTAALKDKSADVRQQAVFALSQIAEGDSRPRGRRAVHVKPAIAPVAAKPAPVQTPAPAQMPAPAPVPR